MNTLAEENYLKSIYHLSLTTQNVSTNQLAALLNTKAASVTDMLKKLADKQLINYARYQGVSLSASGEKIALQIVMRKEHIQRGHWYAIMMAAVFYETSNVCPVKLHAFFSNRETI